MDVKKSTKSINNSPYKKQPILINCILFFITSAIYDYYILLCTDNSIHISFDVDAVVNSDKTTIEERETPESIYDHVETFYEYLKELSKFCTFNDISNILLNNRIYINRDLMVDLNNLFMYDKLMYDKILYDITDASVYQMWGTCLVAMTNIEVNNEKIKNILNLLNDNKIYDIILNIYLTTGPYISFINELNNRNSSYTELSSANIDVHKTNYHKLFSECESFYDESKNRIIIKAAFSYIVMMLSKYNIFPENNETFIESIKLAESYKFTNTNIIKYDKQKDNEAYKLFEFIKDSIIKNEAIDFNSTLSLEPILPLDKRY